MGGASSAGRGFLSPTLVPPPPKGWGQSSRASPFLGTQNVLRLRRPGWGCPPAHESPWGSVGFFLSFHIAHIPHLGHGKPLYPWQYQCQGDSWGTGFKVKRDGDSERIRTVGPR